MAVSSLVTAGSPPSCLLTVTWMFGFFAFHASTTSSMPGAQVQKVSSTFSPDPVEPSVVSSPPPDEQAVARSAVAATTAASLKLVCRRI